ncbi:hypothetical protein COMA2_30239 [Candidatus Nitrospira nitrificans]|jgi:DNA-binding response OmpR family regulator|uniref:OmpR/PhoB-type domain-containing protein n=1 Tax=Candidatus Nitrospira nitrificans TaxID=1742973 RepID=A0A0S4LN47_9BACT|nr:hypothetical protein COMA2_30239 [Candidatus Nitrospira nitrificans]
MIGGDSVSSLRHKNIRFDRTTDGKTTSFTYGHLRMDLTRHEVTVQGKEALLTAKEFGLLEHLASPRASADARGASQCGLGL